MSEKALRAALQVLVNKLEVVHADKRYEAVWVMYEIHGGHYSGPKYADELAAAKQSLIESDPSADCDCGAMKITILCFF